MVPVSPSSHRAEVCSPPYRGRFAPSPSGPLHFGSLVSALGSYLEAKRHHGDWLLRIEDVDQPRTVPGAVDAILHALESVGLAWDEPVLYQSRRNEAYREAMRQLQSGGAIYPCACTRREIADSSLRGIEGQIYPGTCRAGLPQGRAPRAWRVRADSGRSGNAGGVIEFEDALQGRIVQNLADEIGDFVVLRADAMFAYQLAVVVDDAEQRVTHVVRGADLLASTARQIHLQRLLGVATPEYMHLPVVTNAQGEKLSKQTLADPVDTRDASGLLIRALRFLRQSPPAQLAACRPAAILEWAVANWQPGRLSGILAQPETAGDAVPGQGLRR